MNTLPMIKEVQIIKLIPEGNSLNATSQISDISRTTIQKLFIDVGCLCQQFQKTDVTSVKLPLPTCHSLGSLIFYYFSMNVNHQ